MASSYQISKTTRLCVGVDKPFNIALRLRDRLKITIDTANSPTQTCRHIFDLKYSDFINPIYCRRLAVTPEFNSRSRLFPATICLSDTTDGSGQCKLHRTGFIRLIEYMPTVVFKVRALKEMNPYMIRNTLKCTYMKSEYFGRTGIRPFIDSYLNMIQALHACYLSEYLNRFPLTMYDSQK